MRKSVEILRAAAFFAVLATAAVAESPLRQLATGDDGKGWEAVGRINIGGTGYCTGALIAPNLVLTAAHCLFHPTSGAPIPVEDFEFAAGWRHGRADAFRRVRRTATHPEYVYEGRDKVDRVAYDVALLELDQPIRNPAIRPFATAEHPDTGDEVSIVSYATGRDNIPALEEVCEVLARRAQVQMVSCDVDFGASGSPVFRIEGGVARIVSVVSAKAEVDTQRVALAAELGETLETVRRLLESSDGLFTRAGPVAPPQGSQPSVGGAKFLRP